MNARQLFLLNPYRFPGKNSLMLGNDDVSAFLNGYSLLWHPLAIHGATTPPQVASQYDHENPVAGAVYAVPETPPLLLPDDWEERVRNAGAVAFKAGPDRVATFANLCSALQNAPESFGVRRELADLKPEQAVPFLGVGFGFLVLDTLFEAMDHENLLNGPEVVQELQHAVNAILNDDADGLRDKLKGAVERLQYGRDVLYSSNIYLMDVCLLNDQRLMQALPESFHCEQPLNLISSASLLEAWIAANPEKAAVLRERIAGERAEVCGGPYQEVEDALLPLESQLWNLRKGQQVYKECLGQEVRVFARKRFGVHQHSPMLLSQAGLNRALLVAFDDSVLPNFRSTMVSWPSPDGKHIESVVRSPYAADNPQTWFHFAHYLHRTIMQDHSATLLLLHNNSSACPWYEDLLSLSKIGPVLGKWVTFSQYFNEVMSGDYISTPAADDFHGDYLSERINAANPHPVSWFAGQLRRRRRVDGAWTLRTLHRSLSSSPLDTETDQQLMQTEDEVEKSVSGEGTSLDRLEKKVAEGLAQRLVSGATDNAPGYMLLNPCGFARRTVLELEETANNYPIEGPVKACQRGDDKTRLVVEVPALGFVWIPQAGKPGTPPQSSKMKLADKTCVRNEFFEAEIDPATGGIRAFRDHRQRVNRLSQQLVYNPGSNLRVKEVKVTSTGPALGEMIVEGAVVDPYQDKIFATFRQRLRAWLGRPVLEIRIELFPEHLPEGYPWHSYYGSRFAWADERMLLLRGLNGSGAVTSHTRPESPEYLELRAGRQNAVIFTGGLPFHQRHGTRMLDVILIPPGETARTFDLALALDREYPMQTALGLASPLPLVSVPKGPPHIGTGGWLFHLSAPNIMLTSMRPAPDGSDAIVVRLMECTGQYGQAELRCVRDPRRAILVDGRGDYIMEAACHGDTITFDVSASDLVNLRVEFS